MAFATGKESTEGGVVKRYVGVAPVFVIAVNPDKKTLESIYNTNLDKTPEYIGEREVGLEGNKTKVPKVRLDFIVKTDSEKCGIEMISKVSFFLAKEPRYNKDRSKVQVINKYGETTWLSLEDAKAKRVPDNLSWFEPADFRPAYTGEEEVTAFIKAYLNIPNKSYRKANGEVVELADKSEAEARLDNIEKYFKGDFSELNAVIALQPKNKVKCLFGVKSVNEKQYQDVFLQKFLKNNVSDYSKLEAEVMDRKNNGSYPSTEFFVNNKIVDIQEYSVDATNLDAKPVDDDLPFGDNGTPWFND